MDELLGDFLNETAESLDLLDLELVRFEREPNTAGANEYVMKPFDRDIIEAKFHEVGLI
jgi:hypothetical protein